MKQMEKKLLRLDEKTWAKLAKLAKAENRSLNNYLDVILTKHVEVKK